MNEARMRKIAFDMVTLSTTKEVLEKNRVSPNTLTKLRRDHHFQQLLIETRTQIFEEAINKAATEATAAVERLIAISKNKKAPATARVNADKAILEIGRQYYADRKVLDRIEAIEAEMEYKQYELLEADYGQQGYVEATE